MINIRVLSQGCKRRSDLEKLYVNVTAENNITADLQKFNGIKKVNNTGTIITPALTINNIVTLSGKLGEKDR
ncbi:MAG: thioredoxin family protein [Bacteroidetes bacterium]|nr:thioredoxin family protein [Bacteroidota bacterium]